VSADGDELREQAEVIDAELEELRQELSMLVDELGRRREALDPRVQIRHHPLKGALAGGLLGMAGGLALVVARRWHPRPASMVSTAGSLLARARSMARGR